ncbi:MAG: hypothetical protein ABI707_05775 [Ferruginibacter sp.]
MAQNTLLMKIGLLVVEELSLKIIIIMKEVFFAGLLLILLVAPAIQGVYEALSQRNKF